MDCLYIVIPAYNEEANIGQVIDDWYRIVEQHNGEGKSRLVIVDDGSTDSTYQKMLTCARTRPLFTPLTKPNAGHGATVLYGYRYALDHGADYIFQTDSDGQTLPSEFEPFWQNRMNVSVTIGYRNHRQDGFSRIFVTKTLRLVLRIIFGITVTDANTPYRLMNREVLKKYIAQVPKNFNLSNVMLSVLFLYNKEKVEFKPITFRPRQGGVNSINMRRITKIGIHAVRNFWTIKKGLKKR